jgi:hypothetical protein
VALVPQQRDGFDTLADTLRGESCRSAADAIPKRLPNSEYETAFSGPPRTPGSQARCSLRCSRRLVRHWFAAQPNPVAVRWALAQYLSPRCNVSSLSEFIAPFAATSADLGAAAADQGVSTARLVTLVEAGISGRIALASPESRARHDRRSGLRDVSRSRRRGAACHRVSSIGRAMAFPGRLIAGNRRV